MTKSIKAYNTLSVSVEAETIVSIKSVKELQTFVKSLQAENPFYVLGGGSNVLFLNDFSGTILLMESKGISVVKEDENEVWIKAQAGEIWHEFVLWTLKQNFGGLENLSLIPGKVGASPMQNIGAYGVEIKDVFDHLEALEIATNEIVKFDKTSCCFGYRESVFKNQLKNKYIITSVVYRLSKKNHQLHTEYGAIQQQLEKNKIAEPGIEDISRAVIEIRQQKLPDPNLIPNAGSFFKNPVVDSHFFETFIKNHPQAPHYRIDENQVKIPAGWLIEQCGWKGRLVGNVGVHKNQALVLINLNNGSGQDIFDLSESIIEDVLISFGIQLQREVNVVF